MKKSRQLLKTAWICIFWSLSFGWQTDSCSAQTSSNGGQVRTEIPTQDGDVVLISDFQENEGTQYTALGNVFISYKDMAMSSDELKFDQESRQGYARGRIRFTQNDQWLTCSKAEFNFASETAVFYEASGYTDRQFSISSRTIRKTGKDTYRTEHSTVTTCPGDRPKWSFSSSKAEIRIDQTARLLGAVFKVKGVPIFYFPYLIVPLEKKTRSSGFLPFRTGTSTSKGRMFSEGYYQTIGGSSDLLIYGDYFTLRGLAIGGKYRIRPNPTTRFDIEAYGINDKLKQGGVQLIADGESLLKNDWRAVARVNITSNFSFRQAFAENFRSATVSQEHALAFLNRNYESFSTNLSFQRDEVVFPVHSLVIKKLPSLEFQSLGTPLGRSPLVLSFRASLDGLSRLDSTMETERMIQSLDFYPRLALRIPSLLGFSITPSAGFRETYYGARLDDDSFGTVNSRLIRRYADLNVDLRTPVLGKDYSSSWLGRFRHLVEPFATYRRISGIKDFEKIIRFDEQDAIANANEIEYGIINRFFKERQTNTGAQERFQWMAVNLIHKYYFDPTFGGAFRPGQLNSFYPLDTATGLYQTGLARNFSPISAIVQISPQSGIHYDFRTDFDPKVQRWRNESFSAIWQKDKFAFAGSFFSLHPPKEEPPGILTGNTFQGQVDYGSLNRGFSTSFSMSYNIQTSELLNSLTRVSYIWDCCGLSAEFNQYALRDRTESRFSFSFTLKGIGSFGNLRRSENLF